MNKIDNLKTNKEKHKTNEQKTLKELRMPKKTLSELKSRKWWVFPVREGLTAACILSGVKGEGWTHQGRGCEETGQIIHKVLKVHEVWCGGSNSWRSPDKEESVSTSTFFPNGALTECMQRTYPGLEARYEIWKKSPLRLTEPTWSQSLGEPREISLSNAETSPSVSVLPKTGVGAIKQWEIPPSFPRTSLQGSQFQIMHSWFQYKLRCVKERWISKYPPNSCSWNPGVTDTKWKTKLKILSFKTLIRKLKFY